MKYWAYQDEIDETLGDFSDIEVKITINNLDFIEIFVLFCRMNPKIVKKSQSDHTKP